MTSMLATPAVGHKGGNTADFIASSSRFHCSLYALSHSVSVGPQGSGDT